MPDFFVSLERAISRMAKATDEAAPTPSAIKHSSELAHTVMTADRRQMLFHAKLGKLGPELVDRRRRGRDLVYSKVRLHLKIKGRGAGSGAAL